MPSVAVARARASQVSVPRWLSRGVTLEKSILLMRNARSTALTTIRSASMIRARRLGACATSAPGSCMTA